MATILDVAKRAGVSIATVSRYFNQGYVSRESERKISRAVKELDYKINPIARALMKKSSKMTGLILPSITNPFFPELAKAVEYEIHQAGHRLLICNSEGSPVKEAEFISALKAIHADGIITATGNCAKVYAREKIPVVSIDRRLEGSFIHVVSDNREGARLAARELIEKGCRHIVFVGPAPALECIKLRMEGFLEETVRHPEVVTQIAEIEDNDDLPLPASFYSRIRKCDGIMAWNDMTAVRILRMLYNHGIRVPRDMLLVGFDDIDISRDFIPAITTVRQEIYRMGSLAARALLRKIEKKTEDEEEEEDIILEVSLIVRETTQREDGVGDKRR